MPLPVGVSFWAAHSISAKSLLFPEPVGPTIDTTSDLFIVILSKPSLFPSLSVPANIVKDSMPLSSSIPKNSTICLIYSTKPSSSFSMSIAHSSISSSEK